ncbi:unnamed protein product [Clavelina lepadiformis]|uniref:Uncharacterized protein n=1 Tax=Clavelina lepadiformis TaxID=159417 RepID=A0ABP0EUQ4_CLALP
MSLKLTLCVLLVCSLLLSSDALFWSGRRRRRLSPGNAARIASRVLWAAKLFGDNKFKAKLKEIRQQDFEKYQDTLQQIADKFSDEYNPQEVADGIAELDQAIVGKDEYKPAPSDDVDFLDSLNEDDIEISEK